MDYREQDELNRLRKKPRQKLIGGIILLVALCGFYMAYLVFSDLNVDTVFNMGIRGFEIETLSQSLEKTISLMNGVSDDNTARRMVKVALEAAICAGQNEDGTELVPCLHQDGAVIRVSNGSIEYPPGFPENFKLRKEQLTGGVNTAVPPAGTGEEEKDMVYYARIDDSLYYVEWESYSDRAKKQEELFDSNKAIAGMEKAFGMNLLLFPARAGEDGKHPLFYTSGSIDSQEYLFAEDYGITQEMISEAGRDIPGMEEADTARIQIVGMEDGGQTQLLEVDGREYEAYFLKYDSPAVGETAILVCLIPTERSVQIYSEVARVIVAVFFIIGMFSLVWYCATMRQVRDYSLSESRKRELNFRAIIRRSCSLLVIGCVIILAVSAMMLSLVRLYISCRQVDAAFASLQQRIEQNSNEADLTESIRKETYEGFAGQIVRFVENRPADVNSENLQILCDLIGADYIMLFDSRGNETVSNSRYVGLSLGTDPSSSTYDFRRLLTGTELITHDLAVDEATGEEHVMIGASYETPEKEGRYRALLLAVPGEKIYADAAETIDDVMSSLATGGLTAFSADPETGLVLHASDPSFVGKKLQDLGLPDDAIRDGCRDFLTINNKPCHVESVEIDSTLYFYAAEQSHIYNGIWLQAATAALAAAVNFVIFAVFLLVGYREFFDIWSESGDKVKKPDEIRRPGGRRKFSIDPSKRWRPGPVEYGTRAPFHIALLTAAVLLVIVIIYVGIRILFSARGSGEPLMFFIFRGDWTKGFNLFAFTRIVVLLGEVLVAVFLVKLLLYLISNALGTKGETVCRLLLNLTDYVGVIFFLYYTFYYLGFKPSTLLASLGLLSFAISLGAKDLITDIIAGLAIVFEGEYQVGDIIDVGGYRGEVLEIGVRTTKLEGRGANIKIISNRDVKNIINMTRKNSWYPLEVSISCDQSLTQIESILKEKLPHIGDEIPEIVSGPFYKGIVSIAKGSVTLSIIAECNEADYFVVQRSLNRAVQEILEEYSIKVV